MAFAARSHNGPALAATTATGHGQSRKRPRAPTGTDATKAFTPQRTRSHLSAERVHALAFPRLSTSRFFEHPLHDAQGHTNSNKWNFRKLFHLSTDNRNRSAAEPAQTSVRALGKIEKPRRGQLAHRQL